MSAEDVWYLDSSAIVKLVAAEAETPVLSMFLAGGQPLVSSALAVTEVHRAVLHLDKRFSNQADEVLDRIDLVRITNEILAHAGRLQPTNLRSLDAIHLATAALFGSTLSGLVTYDGRMTEAAARFGWSVHAPA